MKKILALIFFILLTSGCGPANNQPKLIEEINILPMKLESPAFKNNEYLPTKYTCDGINVNPPLKISEVPAEAKSLAIVFSDPDAPSGDFVHWLLWNINPATTEISENSVPENAVPGSTSTSSTKYVSPCPPSGTHRYIFKVYALNMVLSLPAGSNKTQLLEAAKGHVLAEGELIGLYTR